MPSNAEVISMITLLLIPCLVTLGLLIWHRKQKAKAATTLVEGIQQSYQEWLKGVETRIQEMTEAETHEEVV